MNFPSDTGCEYYEGDGDVIGRAISECDWTALRNGKAARSFVGFPTSIIGAYIVELTQAMAAVIPHPDLRLDEGRDVAGEDGHWSAFVVPVEWVAAVARTPVDRIPSLVQLWNRECIRVYDEMDSWDERELRDRLHELIILCQNARSHDADVVYLCL